MSDAPQTIEFAENPGFDVSPTAIKHAKRRLLDAGEPVVGLRVGVRGGGCSGYSYLLEFSDGPEEGDLTQQIDGVTVHIAELKRDFVKDCTIDFVDGLLETGFKIKNPNVQRTCGCGESFDIQD